MLAYVHPFNLALHVLKGVKKGFNNKGPWNNGKEGRQPDVSRPDKENYERRPSFIWTTYNFMFS